MKFYEVGPNIALTAHSITVRPLCFSNKTLRRLPEDLQAAVLQAGKDAGTYGRILESSEDRQKLMQMEKEGKLKTIYFKERDQLVKAAGPVLKAYFEENNASDVLQKILEAESQ
jgi:TRAP-type C4-dicarboxylate transport system substrate-binding protein